MSTWLSVCDRDVTSQKSSLGNLFLAAREQRKEGPKDQAYFLLSYICQLGPMFSFPPPSNAKILWIHKKISQTPKSPVASQ